MLAQMKRFSLKELFVKQPMVEERLKILFLLKFSHVSTCWYKNLSSWTWSHCTKWLTVWTWGKSEAEQEKETCSHLAPPEGLRQQRQAGSGLRRVMEKKKNDSLWLCVRVLACALKAKEMICEVIKMSPSADGSPWESSGHLHFHQYLITTHECLAK